jgi:hypothetical protein
LRPKIRNFSQHTSLSAQAAAAAKAHDWCALERH